MTVVEVVTVFLTRNNKILIVRRSNALSSYSGRWSAVSGYLETEPLQQAKTELREETGLADNDFQLLKKGVPLEARDKQNTKNWKVYPFRFKLVRDRPISLNWENEKFRWVKPDEIMKLDTVPKLHKTWERVK